MNCSLSLQMLEMQAECKSLKLKNDAAARFSRDAIYSAMARSGIKNQDAESLPKIIGTTAEVYKAAKAVAFGDEVTN
jgi:hypothetical protein